jgi:D-sedoheptulose 7-phosphate isomerase
LPGVSERDSHVATFLREVAEIAQRLPADELEAMAEGLAAVRARGGRLFIVGVGGGAGHASHAVNDFRKLCHFEAYTPTDNVSELTARTNDEGWETTFDAWLRTSRLCDRDAVLVFSVGGGSREHNISMNLVRALELAKGVGAAVYGIVGRAEGATAELADVCVVVPAPADRATAHVESFQAVLWHLLVSHPALAAQAGKWESLSAP